MNRHQQAVIEYLQEENRVLLEQLGGKPRRFTEAQRIRLARKAKLVGRRRLGQLATLVTSDTLLRWFRVLVAKKWTFVRTNPVWCANSSGEKGGRLAPAQSAALPDCDGNVSGCFPDSAPRGLDR